MDENGYIVIMSEEIQYDVVTQTIPCGWRKILLQMIITLNNLCKGL